MPRSSNQKTKMMVLAKVLSELTDETHALTTQELINELGKYDIPVDRKTIYADIEELQNYGMDIVCDRRKSTNAYFLASRDFELAELKVLVDTVQTARFVTESKSRALIKKLEAQVSVHDAKQLHRQVVISGRVKTLNESIYYSVDAIHTAINNNVQITFQYFQWNLKKEMELRHDGALYHVSPWALIWDDEQYYLVGYDQESKSVRHYRVDKMIHIEVTDVPREGQNEISIDLPKYSTSLFGMFTGEQQDVTLVCDNEMIGAIIDRFGTDIPIIVKDENHFQTRITVSASKPFIGWIVGLGKGVKITAPESMVHAVIEEGKRILDQYTN